GTCRAPDPPDQGRFDGVDAAPGIGRAQQGSEEARLDIRRADDGLCVHAGDGAGERSHRGLRAQGAAGTRAHALHASVRARRNAGPRCHDVLATKDTKRTKSFSAFSFVCFVSFVAETSWPSWLTAWPLPEATTTGAVLV